MARSFGDRLRRGLPGAVATACALLIAAAVVAPVSTAAQSAASGQVVFALPPLQTINWYLPLGPDAYDSEANGDASSMLYLPLVNLNAQFKIDYALSIAKSVTWNAAGTQYVVTLNPKWHWSNGNPVTADDVAFTWSLMKYACSAGVTAPWPYDGCGVGGIPTAVKSVKVEGFDKLVVTLNTKMNQLLFLDNGLAQLTPMPTQAWNKYPGNPAKELNYLTQNASNPSFFSVVDGPWTLASATQNVSWQFTPNRRFDGAKPTIGRFVLAYEASDQAEFDALRSGEVDVGYLPAGMQSSAHLLTSLNLIVPSYPFGINRVALNYRAPGGVGAIFESHAVREAMQLAVPQSEIIKYVYNGLATPGVSFVPEAPPTAFLSPGGKEPVYPFNPVEGKKLLEQSGWHEVGGVMTNAKGQKLQFTAEYPSGSQSVSDIAVLLQHEWQTEGIKVTLKPVPYPALLAQHRQPTTWQIQMEMEFIYGASYPNGAGQLLTGGGLNFYGYNDPKMDALVAETAVPKATVAQLYQALYTSQLYAAHELPTLYLPFPASLNVVSKRLTNVVDYGPHHEVLGLQPFSEWSLAK